MADDAAAEERRKKAQARKEKLASRGADRLAKITGAAKGEGEAPRFGTGGSGEQVTAYLSNIPRSEVPLLTTQPLRAQLPLHPARSRREPRFLHLQLQLSIH